MDDQERFDRYMRLADFRLRRWDARRTNEWKISLGLWGLLAASAYYIPVRLNMFAVTTILTIVLMAYVVFWSLPILVRNDEDMDTAFYYVNRAERLLDSDIDVKEKPAQRLTIYGYFKDRRKFGINSGTWAPFFQIIATAILVFITWWILSQKPWPK